MMVLTHIMIFFFFMNLRNKENFDPKSSNDFFLFDRLRMHDDVNTCYDFYFPF